MVTVLLLPGEKTCPAEEVMAEKLVPFVLPCTVSVSVRWPQPSGSLSTTWSMLTVLPRSTWPHCGRAPELSQ